MLNLYYQLTLAKVFGACCKDDEQACSSIVHHFSGQTVFYKIERLETYYVVIWCAAVSQASTFRSAFFIQPTNLAQK